MWLFVDAHGAAENLGHPTLPLSLKLNKAAFCFLVPALMLETGVIFTVCLVLYLLCFFVLFLGDLLFKVASKHTAEVLLSVSRVRSEGFLHVSSSRLQIKIILILFSLDPFYFFISPSLSGRKSSAVLGRQTCWKHTPCYSCYVPREKAFSLTQSAVTLTVGFPQMTF